MIKRWFDNWNPWALRYRIEMLESELWVKEKERDLAIKGAQFNSQEKNRAHRALSLMRTEIQAAIGLLREVAKEEETGAF